LWQYLMLGARPFGKYQDGVTYFHHPNNLGTTGVATNQMGDTIQDVNYYPWGLQWNLVGTNKDKRFASLTQDNETGLYNTWFRKYSSNQGRWLSPDPVAGNILNPQSLNRYSYVLNNSTDFIDSLGLDAFIFCVPSQAVQSGYPDDPHIEFLSGNCFMVGSISGGGSGGDGGSHGRGGSIGKAKQEAEKRMKDPQCAAFLRSVLSNLGLSPDLNLFGQNFKKLTIEPSPAKDSDKPKFPTTAHIAGAVNQTSTVHVDAPGASDLPQTLLHEEFHSIYYGFNDITLAKAAGKPVPDCEKGDRNEVGSRNASEQFNKNCGPGN